MRHIVTGNIAASNSESYLARGDQADLFWRVGVVGESCGGVGAGITSYKRISIEQTYIVHVLSTIILEQLKYLACHAGLQVARKNGQTQAGLHFS